MSEQEIILSDIKKAVLSVDKTADVLLFGSRARGDYHEESDWDILILTGKKVDRTFRLQILSELLILELNYNIGISPVFKNKDEWIDLNGTDFYNTILEDGFAL